MRILLTGSTGFIGSRLVQKLNDLSICELTSVVRNNKSHTFGSLIRIDKIDGNTKWDNHLKGVDFVIHTAARNYTAKDKAVNPYNEYRQVNVDGTLNLARQASLAGVKRFIFLSSIKVNGEQTKFGKLFSPNDPSAPKDSYGLSKSEAERGLLEIANKTSMEILIIRAPLVYGPGVKGNFANLVKILKIGLPLPLGAINNKRSMIALDNLVDFILYCIEHPKGANQVFLVADGEDLSTTELLKKVSLTMNKPSHLIPFPAWILKIGLQLLGKNAIAQRLIDSLQVDISKTKNLLGWEPPLSVDEGLRRCFNNELKVK